MKTDWQLLSKKLGVLRDDNSESYQSINSSQALEEILGDEWLQHAVDTFIEGTPGNELAIKTLRYINSTKAAAMAYKIYNDNKDTDKQKASLAVWALSDIRTPLAMDYVEEIMTQPQYEGIAFGVFRNLVFDHLYWFEEKRLYKILDKFSAKYGEEKTTLLTYLNNEYHKETWYDLLTKIQKRPMLYGIQKVEDIYSFWLGYSIALSDRGIIDGDLLDFDNNYTKFVMQDYASTPPHCNWCTAIRLYSSSDVASVELFFEELAKYKSGDKDFDRIQYREDSKIFCCQDMANKVTESIDSNGIIKYNNVDVIINKWGNGTYGIPIHDGGTSVIAINNCPWCGSKLK
jgi:hypothetical protein